LDPRAQGAAASVARDDPDAFDDLVHGISDSIDAADWGVLRVRLDDLWPAEIADVLEALDAERRHALIAAVGADLDPEFLAELDEGIRGDVLAALQPADLAAALTELETDDAVEVIGDLQPDDVAELLSQVPEADRVLIEQGLAYERYTAGRLMRRDLVKVPAFWTVGDTIDFARGAPDLPEDFYEIYVVDPRGRLLGTLALSKILRTRRAVRVDEIMETDVTSFPDDMDQEEMALAFRKADLVSAPIIDAEGLLLGIVTVDDILDVIDEEAEDDILRLGGIAEGDLYRASWQTTRSRFPWLLVNLGTAVVASLVIAQFDATISQIVALAILMPIVASMGGNAGTQTLTIAVRGLAMKQITRSNAFRVLGKEVIVGTINGVGFAVIAGIMAALWFSSVTIGAVIAAAMVVNLMVAGLFGVGIPVALDRMKIDPAIASTVLLTTVTDVVGFLAFLGLATLVLL